MLTISAVRLRHLRARVGLAHLRPFKTIGCRTPRPNGDESIGHEIISISVAAADLQPPKYPIDPVACAGS